MSNIGLTDTIKSISWEIEPVLISIRRELHMYPELAAEEYRTAELIAKTLREIPGMEVFEGLAEGTGVAGILTGASPDGACVMLRADIDALRVQEDLPLPYRSRIQGQMHACGHDVHATWILGAAMILSRIRSEWSGTVKFVFQPGEECGKGAIPLVYENHILEDPKVDAVFAGHVWPTVSAGQIGIAEKYAFGCPGGFELRIKGKGGHGSWPHQCINPITAAVQIYQAFESILADNIDPVEPRVISIGSIHAGEAGNIVPDICTMKGTIRATEHNVMEQLADRMEEIVSHICAMHHAEYEFSCRRNGVAGGKAVINDPAMTEIAKASASAILGDGNCFIIHRNHLGGENFSEYSSRVPGCYIFVGNETEENKGKFGLHSPEFKVNEEIISPAAAVFAQIVINTLQILKMS